MSVEIVPELQYYYDLHPTEEDLMGENDLHINAITHLFNLLKWMYSRQGWFIARNLNLYTTQDRMETPVAPDVAVFKGIVRSSLPESIPSWAVGPWNPYFPGQTIPPTVVIEVASEGNWQEDLEGKRLRYAAMGVREYYLFAPAEAPLPRQVRSTPLRGWRQARTRAVEMKADNQGWIWSEELESWLGQDGTMLNLYDRDRKPRLTEAQAQCAEKEAERSQKEKAWDRLREMGIDPQEL